MATAVDIPAPICETREEQGVDEVTSILINKLPNEEQSQAHKQNGLSTFEGDNFLTAPSIGEVHCEVNNGSSDVSMVTEKPDDQHKVEESNSLEKEEEATESKTPMLENPAESLHVAPEASILGQEKNINATLHENAGGETEEKSIDAVNKQKEILESLPTISSTSLEEGSINAVLLQVSSDSTNEKIIDGTHTQKEVLENDFSNEDVKGNSTEHGEPRNAEFCENESRLLKIESKVEKSEDPLHATSEDIDAPEVETTSCIDEQSVTTHPRGEKTQDEAAEREEIIENVPTVVSIEKTESIQIDGPKIENEDHLEKDAEQSPPLEDFTGKPEVKIDAELLEEQNTESALVKEHVQKEKPLESLHAALEDNIPSELDQHTETSYLKEKTIENEDNGKDSLIQVDARDMEPVEDANHDESINLVEPKIDNECNQDLQNASEDHKASASSEDIETTHSHNKESDSKFDASNTEEATHENITTETQHEHTEENSVTQVDCSQIEVEEHSEKAEAPIEETKADKSKNIQELENKGIDSIKAELENQKDAESTSVNEEPEVENPIDTLQTANQEIKASNSSQDTNNCIAEQVPTECSLDKEEAQVEKPIDTLLVPAEDIKASESCRETYSIDEKIPTADPEETPCVKTEDEAVDAAETEGTIESVPTVVSIEKTEDNSLIQIDGTKIENEDYFEEDADQPSPIEDLTGNIVTDEVKIDDENPSRAELLEEKNTEDALLKEETQKEKPFESLHAALEDIKPSELEQQAETSFLEEKSLTENPQEILGEETEEKTIDVVSNEDNEKDSLIQVDAREMRPSLTKAEMKDDNHDKSINLVEPKIVSECNESSQNASEDHKVSASSEDIEAVHSHEESLVTNNNTIDPINTEEATLENATTEIQHEYMEENSVTLADCSQIEQEEHLEKDGENSSWTEAPVEETKADKSKNIQELENKGIDLMKAELENEKDAKSTSVNEKSEVENPIDTLEMVNQDIKASDSSQVTNSCTAEQLPTAKPDDLSSDKTEKESVDAIEAKEESLEDIVTNIPDGDNADNTPIEEDAAMVNNNAEEPTVAHEATAGEIEKITDCTSVKEEVSTESSALGHDEETSSQEEKSITTNPQGIVAEEETHEDKENIGKTTPYEDIEESTLVQEDYPQLEQKFFLENDNENTSSREVLIGEITDCSMDKEEAQVEKPIESLQVPSDDIKVSESCRETYSIDEKIPTADPEEIPCVKTEDEAVDAAETEGTIESVPTVVSIEKTEDNSLIQIDGPKIENEDHLEKNAYQPSPIEDFTGNIVTDEVKIDDENQGRAELLEEENTAGALLKEEMQKEKPLESTHAVFEDIKPSELEQQAETTSFLEEKSLTENPQEILGEETEEKTIDAVSNEDNDKDSLIQVDAREIEPSLTKAEMKDANHDEPINLVEPKIVNECNEGFQNASEDHKVSASSEDIEVTLSHKEESLVTINNTIDPTNTEEETHENVTAEIQHEHMEENSVTLVNSSQIEQDDHLDKDGETKADESKNIQELENKGIDSMEAELEYEKDKESASVKEEAEVENSIDSLKTDNQDIKASVSSQDAHNCMMEQLPTANPGELSGDHQTEKESVDTAEAKEESLEDIVSHILDGDNADNTPIEEDGSQGPSFKDATMGNNNVEEATVAHEAKPVGENEKITECTSLKDEVSTESSALCHDEETSCLEEKSLTTNPQGIMDDTKDDKTDDSIVAEEETPEDKENNGKTTPYEDVKENKLVQEDSPQLEQKKDLENDSENTSSREVLIEDTREGSLDKEEAQVEKPIESLQVPVEDIKASESCRDTYSFDEKILTADPEEIPCVKTEETTTDSAYTKNENLELQNVENVPNEGSDSSKTDVEGPQKISLEETSIGNNNDAESAIIHDAKFADENIVKADLLGNKESIECSLVKEEVPLKSLHEAAQEERPTDSSQEAQEEIKASDSSKDTHCYIEEKSLNASPQEISSDKTERESIDAINRREESIEVKDIPDGDDAVNSPIEEDGSQNPHLKEATTRNDNDDESTVTNEAKLVGENEKDTECTLVKEEVSTELLQVETQETKVSASGQDRETSSLEFQRVTTEPQGFVEETEEETRDATSAETETPEDKDVATNPYGDIEENLLLEVDCKQAEQNEDSVNDSGNTSSTEAQIGETGEDVFVKEDAHEKFESLQVATEDIQASSSCQETSSIEEQILTGDSQEISCDKIEERTIDATYTTKENLEEVATKIPNASDEDNSPIQVDGLQKPHLEEASNTQGIMGNQDKTIDVTDLKEETHEDKSYADISYEDTTENSSVQVDCSQLEENEHSEKGSESTSLTEAPSTDTAKSTLVNEVQNEDHTESLQVATEDIKALSPCEDISTSSTEEQALTVDPKDISGDKTIEKTIAASDNEKTTEVQVENEDIKATASSHDRETIHLEEQGLNTDPQGIMGDHKEDKAIDVTKFKEETHENKGYATTSYEDTTENSLVQVDCSHPEQNEHSEKVSESTSLTEVLEAGTIESSLVEEEAKEDHVESLKAATGDVKSFSPSQDMKTITTEEQILTVDPEDILRDNTIDSFDNEKTFEVQEKNTEGTLKEDADIESPQESTEVIKASNSSEDRDTHSQGEQILCANPEGLKDEDRESETIDPTDLPKETLKDEVPREIEIEEKYIEEKEEEGYLKDMSASVNITVHEEKDLDVVEEVAAGHLAEDSNSKKVESSITEESEVHMIINHENVPDVTSLASEVVEEGNSCSDKTDTEKISVLDDGSTMIPTNETLPETDPRGSTEAEVQVPDGEKEEDLVQHDLMAETDQKAINGQLLIEDSQVISDSKGVNDEEEKTNSDNCKDLEKAPLSASDENIIETTECKESDIVEDAIKIKEGDDRTESFFDEEKATEREQEETESGQEKLISDEKVQTTTSASELEDIDLLPIMRSETSKLDHSTTEGEVATDREELNAGKTASDGNEDTRIDNIRSITELESENVDEVPEIIQTTLSASEGQDVESASVGETTALKSECQIDGYEHANTSSMTEERPDSNEVVLEPGEQRSEYESKTQVLESVSQVQSCEIVAETEETKTEEKNLETAGEIESDKVVAEDISDQEETKHKIEILKENIPCKKAKEGGEDVEDYHQGSHHEEMIIGSRLEEEANREEEINTGFEDIKNENETEKVPKISQVANDKALEEPEENLLGKESINRGLDQTEQSKSVQEVTTALDSEEAQALDVACVNVGAHNSNEEINRSTVAISDEEENRTGADDTENEMAETYVEPEQLDFSPHIKDISEVPITDGAQVIPEDNESSITKNTSSEEDCPHKSKEPQILTVSDETELTEQASEATRITAEMQEAKDGISSQAAIPNATELESRQVQENLKQETEEEQLDRASGDVTEAGVNCEEKNINDKSNQLENSWGAETEKVSESNTYQSLMDETHHHDKVEGSPRQIDSLSVLPEAKCSEIETTEKDIPAHFAGVSGTGVTQLEVTPPPSKDKHAVLEADHATVLSSENAYVNEKLSKDNSQGEHDLHEPSKVEQQEADCENEDKTDQETAEKAESKENNKPSLSDLFDVSMRGTSKMAMHSAIDGEPTTHKEDLHSEKHDDDQHENAKTEEENDDEDDSSEQKRSELSSEAPVMVDMADADVKVSHKKSHNILSGVGSKVKHSIAKVKKVITGKSSNSKTPSPKKYTS